MLFCSNAVASVPKLSHICPGSKVATAGSTRGTNISPRPHTLDTPADREGGPLPLPTAAQDNWVPVTEKIDSGEKPFLCSGGHWL